MAALMKRLSLPRIRCRLLASVSLAVFVDSSPAAAHTSRAVRIWQYAGLKMSGKRSRGHPVTSGRGGVLERGGCCGGLNSLAVGAFAMATAFGENADGTSTRERSGDAAMIPLKDSGGGCAQGVQSFSRTKIILRSYLYLLHTNSWKCY